MLRCPPRGGCDLCSVVGTDRPVAAEMGVSRACASKWVNRYRKHGELGLLDRFSAPRRQPTATSSDVVARIEALRRAEKWSASRIAFELQAEGVSSAAAPYRGISRSSA